MSGEDPSDGGRDGYTDTSGSASTSRLRDLVDRLLVPDQREHRQALDALAGEGDRRVIPHLVEVATIHAVATDWGTFGFPEVLREGPPPRSLTHPEVRWPGAVDALNAIADPTFDSRAAWLRWESWMTREGIEPLAGFPDWKARLYRTYHPLVGQFFDAAGLDPATVRWGNTDPASLHPLNGPEFGEGADHLRDSDPVFGVRVDGQAVAVPRYLLFPHELLNARIAGVPVAVTYCTMCNSPICYDRRIDPDLSGGDDDRSDDGDRRTLSFGSTGLIRQGNKLMFDEETRTLWSQHRGVPVAGRLAENDLTLSMYPITRTEWTDWYEDNPDTLVLSPDTGYDYDYEYYRDYEGFVRRHYWENESVTHPGVAPQDDPSPGERSDADGRPDTAGHALDDKTEVFGVEVGDGVRVYPVETVDDAGVILDVVGDRRIAVTDLGGDSAAYEAPPGPLSVSGDRIRDGDGTAWRVTPEALVAEGSDDTRPRLPGRHGLWLAFRVGYGDPTVVTGG